MNFLCKQTKHAEVFFSNEKIIFCNVSKNTVCERKLQLDQRKKTSKHLIIH